MPSDQEKARNLAQRLELSFDPLSEFNIDPDLFRTIPVEVMLRYHFLPLRSEGETLHVIMADPSNVISLNNVELMLARPLEVAVGPASRINDILALQIGQLFCCGAHVFRTAPCK